jgi:hypothetical protein
VEEFPTIRGYRVVAQINNGKRRHFGRRRLITYVLVWSDPVVQGTRVRRHGGSLKQLA